MINAEADAHTSDITKVFLSTSVPPNMDIPARLSSEAITIADERLSQGAKVPLVVRIRAQDITANLISYLARKDPKVAVGCGRCRKD